MNRVLQPISSDTIRVAVDRGELRCVRVGGRLMIDRADLAAHLESRRVIGDEGAR